MIKIVMGDARLTLQQIPDRSCDILVIDAFCGDAIPVHLLTRQAMAIYTEKLDKDGILAIHISNMYLDLLPVCSALAADAGCIRLLPQRSGYQCGRISPGQIRVAMGGDRADARWPASPRCAMAAASVCST